MPSRRLLAALAVCAALAASAPCAAAAAPPAPGAAPYGLVASNANFVPGDTLAERAANYRRLYMAGVRAIRLDINWRQVEPPGKPLHDYDFAERDREVRAIEDAGLRVIGILGYGHPDYSALGGLAQRTPVGQDGLPPFQLGASRSFPPDDPREFARYARATAAHYARRFPGEVIAWEVWNEENEGYRFWAPHESPSAYARLLCATYPALKSADPGASVLFGGVFFPAVPPGLPGMSGPQFVSAAYRSHPGLGRCYDAMAYHPYAYPFTAPELDVPIRGSVLSAAAQMRAVLRRHGDGAKPLWITEVGWPTSDRTYGVPEAKQAEYVARMQAATFAEGVPVLTWYTYGDAPDPTGGANQEAHFGLFRADNTPKPAYAALRVFARTFRGTAFARDLSRRLGLPRGRPLTGGRGFALQYERPGARGCEPARVTAVWLASESVGEGQGPLPAGGTLTPASAPVRLPVRARSVTLTGYLGGEKRVRAHRGAVELQASAAPVYVTDPGRC